MSGRRQLVLAVLSSLICNSLLWYDYVLFGSLATVVGKTFFPSGDNFVTMLYTFGVFAVGFWFRPVGAVIFGHMGDTIGRKFALTVSISSMTLPVIIITVLPSYDQWGIASPIVLVIVRILQGLSLGGEAGNAAFLIEHSKGSNVSIRGLLGSFEVLSAVIGSAMATSAIIILSNIYGVEAFDKHAWRLAFLFGFILGSCSVVIRYMTAESPAYSDIESSGGVSKSPIKDLWQNYRKAFMVSVGIDAIENAAFHSLVVFFNAVLTDILGMNVPHLQYIEFFSMIVLGVFTLIFAYLSDVFGRHAVLSKVYIGVLVLSLPVYLMLVTGEYWFVLAAYVIYAILVAGAFGPISAAMSELFPTRIRFTGFSLSRNVAAAIFGGLAPYISTWLIRVTNVPHAPAFYLMAVSAISLFSMAFFKSYAAKVAKEDVALFAG